MADQNALRNSESPASALDTVNAALAYSPYLLPGDDESAQRAARVIHGLEDLEQRVEQLRSKLREEHKVLRDLMDDVVTSRLVYESNAIEGLGPSLQETHLILNSPESFDADAVLTLWTMRKALQAEPKIVHVLGMRAAQVFADRLSADPGLHLSAVDLRNIHGLVLQNQWEAGQFKSYHNRIEQSDHIPVDPMYVAEAIGDLLDWVNSTSASAVLKSCVAHAWFAHIHPFADGNGRVARILANLVLAHSAVPPLIVKSQADRGEYIDALAHSDEGGDLLPLLELFRKLLKRSIRELENPQRMRDLFERNLLGTDVAYRRWEITKDRFMALLVTAAAEHGLYVESVGGLAAADYHLLAVRNSDGNGWLAKLRSREGRVNYLLWMGFESDEMMEGRTNKRADPSLFISVRDRSPLAVHPYRALMYSPEISLKEITLRPADGRAHIRDGGGIAEMSLEQAAERLVAAVVEAARIGAGR